MVTEQTLLTEEVSTAVALSAVDEAQEPEEFPTDKFRFACMRVHLTYKTHLVKEDYKAWAKSDMSAKDVHVSHETADKRHPYEHTHVIIEWIKAFQTRNTRRFDYQGIHPNIKPITTKKQLEHTYTYIAKEDPESQYLLTKMNTAFAKGVWSCATVQEALLECQKPSDVLGTIAMFKNKPPVDVKKDLIEVFRPWQLKLMNELQGEPDDRHIIWIYDKVGNAGKSRLGRHIEDSGMGILISGTCSTRDIAFMIGECLDSGECIRIIMLDLTRSFQDRDIYNTLEMIKNGRMFSPKYQSKRIRWTPGHVVVFANFLPSVTGCSSDRWLIRAVMDNDYDEGHHPKHSPRVPLGDASEL